MNWSDVIADPSLQNLPYKIELNGYGQIVMTPASNRHGRLQAEVSFLLSEQAGEGIVITEASILTPAGVKVADVVWLSDRFSAEHGEATPFPAAPELCVEVISPSNTRLEMQEKSRLYFDQGAREVWFCDEEGILVFLSPQGQLEVSGLFPQFPTQVD